MPAGREGPTRAAARVTSSSAALLPFLWSPLIHSIKLCSYCVPPDWQPHRGPTAAGKALSSPAADAGRGSVPAPWTEGTGEVQWECALLPHTLGGIQGQKSVPSVWRGLKSCCLRGHTPPTGSKGGSSWPLPAPGTPWLAAVSAPALRRPHVALGVCALTHVSCRDSGWGTRSP